MFFYFKSIILSLPGAIIGITYCGINIYKNEEELNIVLTCH